jgi:photosystem II stability/assembly factor-like uncharacterized protein
VHDLAFLPDHTGVLTVDAVGATDAAAIQVTRDDGAHWRTVWQSPRVELGAIGTRAGVVYVTASSANAHAPDDFSPLLLVGTDRGRRWRTIRPRLPADLRDGFLSLRPYFVTPSLGFAVPNPEESDVFEGTALLRTTDGGRSWLSVRGPRPTGGIVFSDPRDGLLTGAITYGAKCEQVLRTTDAGLHWQPVAGTCGRAYLDALALGPGGDAAVAAGGNLPKFGFFPQLAVVAGAAARGGGWRTRFARGGLTPKQGGGGGGGGGPGPSGQFVQIAFPEVGRGMALVGGCPGGANPPCIGDLWTSSDGGRHWHDTGRSGSGFTAVDARDVWLFDGDKLGGNAVLSHSTDGGRTWTSIGRPDAQAPSSLVGSPSQLFARTMAGDFISTDAAASWQPAADPALAAPSRYITPEAIAAPGLIAAVDDDGDGRLWISRDGGRTGATVRPAGFVAGGAPAVAFADATHGLSVDLESDFLPVCSGATGSSTRLPVDATADGGRNWHALARLPGPADDSVELALSGRLAVVLGPCVAAGAGVGLSRDGGVHWSLHRLPAGLDCGSVAVASARTIALGCAAAGRGPSELDRLLVSRDGGASWTDRRVTGACTTDAGCALTGAFGRLWLAGTGVLWSSPDGQRWTAVPGRYPVAG